MKVPTAILLACAGIVGGLALRAGHMYFVPQQIDRGGWPMMAVLAVLALGILVGLVRGNRFAWQVGRILSMVAGAFLFVWGVMAIASQKFGDDSTILGVWWIASAACFAIAAALLHTRPARQHMKLICPKCQTPTSRPANLSFSEARCRNPQCNHKW